MKVLSGLSVFRYNVTDTMPLNPGMWKKIVFNITNAIQRTYVRRSLNLIAMKAESLM